MKALGKDILDFYEAWPPGTDWCIDYVEEYLLGEDSELRLEPERRYQTEDFGLICWQGLGEPPKGTPARGDLSCPFTTWYKAWKKSQTSASAVVEVPHEKREVFEAWCKAEGLKVTW